MDESKVVSVPQRTYPVLKKNSLYKALSNGAGSIIGACAVAAACGWKNPGVLGKVAAGCVLSTVIDITKQTIEDKRDDKRITLNSAGTAFAKGVVSSAVIMSVAVLIVSYLNKGKKEDG